MALVGDIATEVGRKAGADRARVYSVTKYDGFVPSDEYFNKQVFSRDLSSYKLVDVGTFAYATIHLDEGSIGIAPETALISPMYTAFKINLSQVEPRYLIRLLKSPRALQAYSILGEGSANRRRSIPFKRLATLEVPVPDLNEQRRIADILDKADALRAKRREAMAHLDSLGQSIFHNMFGGVDMHELGSRLQFMTSGGRGWAKYYAAAGKRFIRSLDVQRDAIASGTDVFVIPPDSAEARRTAVRGGDVLLTITGSLIGRASAVPEALGDSYISQHVAILRSSMLEPRFLSGFLNSDSGQKQINSAQYGQTKPGLNFERIRRFRVPDAPMELQQKYANRVAAVERLKMKHNLQMTELDNLFLSLQDRAFKGVL
ncbi:restriction endonuclease subunit S [Glutamicibacter arilaitensis]|uniref:Type I restriction modification DNA specificity domain-containing protein n=1 Tax=Glutamicibacter arilaitensis TaxID=256701 RepID=A0A2N7RXE0_9MICC|nr:restriction endonuclease subunit S [Glutamicibacter arilaitensis]PMQ18557.1 hypothetical protein CIK84_18525 [Glutamicibacter arilaitensis]